MALPGLGQGIGLNAQTGNILERMEDLSAQKARQEEQYAHQEQERQNKIKDLGLEEYIKGVHPDYEHLNPVFYKTAENISKDFIVNAMDLYNKSKSPQEFTAMLSGEGNKAAAQFAGLYNSSSTFNNFLAMPKEKLTPFQQSVQSTMQAASSKGDINDLNTMMSGINDEKKEFSYIPYNGTPGSGMFKLNYTKSDLDPDAIAAKEAKDLPTYSEGKGRLSRLGNKTFNDIPLIPFQTQDDADKYAISQGLASGSVGSIESKVNSILTDPKYTQLQNDWFHQYYGNGQGERNSDGSLNMDRNVMSNSLRNYITGKLVANQPKSMKTREATDQEEKEWQYKLSHPEGGDVEHPNLQLAQANFSKSDGSSYTQSNPSTTTPSVSVQLPDNTLIFDQSGQNTTQNIGANAKTGTTMPMWVVPYGKGKYDIVDNQNKENFVNAINNGKKINALPVLMTEIKVPAKDAQITGTDPNNKDVVTYDKYTSYWVPTSQTVDYQLGVKGQGLKGTQMEREKAKQQLSLANQEVEKYIGNSSPDIQKLYNSTFRVNITDDNSGNAPTLK